MVSPDSRVNLARRQAETPVSAPVQILEASSICTKLGTRSDRRKCSPKVDITVFEREPLVEKGAASGGAVCEIPATRENWSLLPAIRASSSEFSGQPANHYSLT